MSGAPVTLPAHLAGLSPAARELAALVPQVYLARDAERPDRPLARLLEVLGAPLADLAAAIGRLEDDAAVERARAEVLPLLADLVGARLLGSDARTNRGVVASTVRWRRDAGTLPTLEDVLTTTTGWPTEVDEAFRSVLATADLDDLLRHRGRTAVVTDPVPLADPLSRPATPAPALATGEPALLEELERIGAADALRPAVSPRTLDLDGWVRPDRVVVRTTRLAVREVDEQEVVHVRAVAHRDDPAAFVGVVLDPRGEHLDPAGRPVPFPLAGARLDAEPLLDAAWRDRREPDPPRPPRRVRGAEVVTATGLAADPTGAERADLLTVRVDGVVLVGPDLPLPAPGPLPSAAPGALGVLRLADADRPSPGERWRVQVVAVDAPERLATTAGDPALEPAEDPGSLNPLVAEADAGRGDPGAVRVSAAGRAGVAGAQVAVRLRRTAPTAHARAADGTWAALDVVPRRGHPRSGTVALDVAGELVLARVERRPGGGLDLALLRPDTPGDAWQLQALDLPDLDEALLGDVEDDGPWLTAAGAGGALVLAGPVRPGAGAPPVLALWRVDGLDAAALDVARLDDPAAPAPAARLEAAAVVAGGRLWLHGGRERDDAGTDADGARALRADLWSVAVDGAGPRAWTRHRARHAPARAGARLVPLRGGLALVGGAERPGELARTVRWVDPAVARPDWTALPDLPLPAGPGALWARADGDALVVVAWADRTRPAGLRLEPDAARWGAPALDGGDPPNPPAEGDGVLAGERLLVPGPVPLPPSEVLVDDGAGAALAALPALDPADGAVALVLVDADGSGHVWPGTVLRPSLRLGSPREASPTVRRLAALRLGVPGRLGWAPFRVRQVDLTSWDRPLALTLDGEVAVDPRLGRVLAARDVVGPGRLAVTYRTGRAAALGAGFAPPGRALPPAWLEPADPADAGLPGPGRWEPATAPELDVALAGGPAPATARVDPPRAGGGAGVVDANAVDAGAPVVAGPAEALAGPGAVVQPLDAVARRVHVVPVDGSPRLAPATLVLDQGVTASVFAAAAGSAPHVGADDGVSLTLLERLVAGEDPDVGPSWFLTGLGTDGAVELLAVAGLLDVRWCDLAPPRRDDAVPGDGTAARLGVRVAGAGRGALPTRAVPAAGPEPDAPLVLRLVGCVLGGVVVPPWVRVVAAGCTLDAGADDALALDAAGAHVRLRACTVRGRVRAGVLEASSTVLRGGVDVDRPGAGWLRHSVLDARRPGRVPVAYASLRAPVSLASLDSTSPAYLLLDENNPPGVLAAGEGGGLPGAHGARSTSLRELAGRSGGAVPIGLTPYQVDRAAEALRRMGRGPA